jgi:hypothetical protein
LMKEDALATGVAMYAAVALEFLKPLAVSH